VREGERWLVGQRPAGGRMAGLWELPTIEPSGARLLAEPEWPGTLPALTAGDEVGVVAHAITRHRIRARVFEARLAGGEPASPLRFVNAAEIAELGPTGLTAKVLRADCARSALR